MRALTWTRLTVMVPLAVAAMLGPAAGRPGDERVIEGTLVWPETVDLDAAGAGERMVIVHDDFGSRYVAQVSTSTEIPTPLQAGQRVVIRGREGFDPTHVAAGRLTSPAADAAVTAPGATSIEGTVVGLSGNTVVLQTSNERQVTVDVSAIGLPVRELLHRGRGIRVFGTREGTRLVASGVELHYVPAAPSAPSR
jgi:RNase P/RNase MRP subunit p29